MFYKGIYHLFYQHNPNGAELSENAWIDIVWAHSVSEDLINWTPLEPAIKPSKTFDQYGCWSGSATILPDEKPVIMYTGIISETPLPGYQVQNYAIPENYSDPYLTKWIKPDDNPILTPTVEVVTEFRDPTTAWMLNGQWEMTIGSVKDTTGISYLYRSPDFITWTLVDHPLHQQDNVGMWECPDFYPVSTMGEEGLDTSVIDGDIKHVFKVSLDLTRYDYYTIGKYDTKQDLYIPDEGMIDGWAGLRYDWGNFYASKSFYDPSKNRRVIWGWVNESSTVEESVKRGWAGIMSIPRAVWLDPSGNQLLLWPVAEIETLRDQNQQLSNVELQQGDRIEVEGITAAQADVDVVFTFPGLDKAEMYDTKWDETFPPEKLASSICQVLGQLYQYRPTFGGFVDVDLADNKISLRSLIDHSVVESFAAGGKTIITSRVYPTLALGNDAHLHVFNHGSETVTIESLNAWSMKSPQMN
ncbi:hypothetical protein L1987_82375 [Smallanthus sonchifolius]|uniref:Uncharacterized protein n=1 Tax=Smallanthus sonchifolius TaxID=185202 RepID=A0ACB8YAD3_9ASTR|nr:hypothetical protein L1987_82375 [Smallanthus sonchifolius]